MKNIKILLSSILTAATCFALMSVCVKAAPFEDQEFSIYQPDETQVKVIATGDEFYQHVESPDGYTLIRNDDKWICYAKLNEDGTELVPTDTVYKGENDNVPEGLEKHLDITQDSVDKKVTDAREKLNVGEEKGETKGSSLLKTKAAASDNPYDYSQPKTIKGLTVIVDFLDEKTGFTNQEVIDLFNKSGYNKFGNNGSVHDYFYDISNGNINYTNKVIRYIAKNNKSYYTNYSNIDPNKSAAQELIQEIDQYITKMNFDLSDLTKKPDGSIYMLNILYAGECDNVWAEGLWPHKSQTTFRNNSNQIYEMTNLGSSLSIGTICHENGHGLLNYPDLYVYKAGTSSIKASLVGDYCLMGGGGSNGERKNPAPPNPYLRYMVSKFPGTVTNLGSISNGQVVSLTASDTGCGRVYKWNNSNKSSEYYLIENITKANRYYDVKNEGLVVWHIDTTGSNDDIDNSKYLVTMVEADGGNNLKLGKGNDIVPFSAYTNSAFNSSTAPNGKWYSGLYSGLYLSNISVPGRTMTFKKGYYDVSTGFHEENGKKYYVLDRFGRRAKGSKFIDGKEYYFDEQTGIMTTGWRYMNSEYRYYDENGVYVPNNKGVALDAYFVNNFSSVNMNPVSKYHYSVEKDLTIGVRPHGYTIDNGYTYCYQVSYRSSSHIDEFSTQDRTIAYTPYSTGLAIITVKVKDQNGRYVCDYKGKEISDSFTLEFDNTISITSLQTLNPRGGSSMTSGNIGVTVRLSGTAKGGCGYINPPLKYDYIISRNGDKNYSYNIVGGTSGEQTWTPTKSGTYTIILKVKDAVGSTTIKSVTYTVN